MPSRPLALSPSRPFAISLKPKLPPITFLSYETSLSRFQRLAHVTILSAIESLKFYFVSSYFEHSTPFNPFFLSILSFSPSFLLSLFLPKPLCQEMQLRYLLDR
ncbi:hypothetical protein ACMFMG_005537 [Clarireedia jacksonii]